MLMRVQYPLELIAVLVLFLEGLPIGGASAQTTLQGPNDCTAAGAYTLCQNLWGADTGTGSQTTTLNSAGGSSVSWSTSYTWAGSPNNVKSYPNVYHNTAKGMQLQDIVSAPTSWQWYYQSASNDLAADVSYDIWTGVPQSGDPASLASSYEIMIWLSDRGGVGGIGNVVAQNIQVGGHTWNLKQGPNSNWDVFSFITAEGDITNFNSDLKDFFQYLIDNQGVAKTQYLQAIQTGTEPFTGTADLVISNFSVDVSTVDDSPTSSSSSPISSSSHSSSTSASAQPSNVSSHGTTPTIATSSASTTPLNTATTSVSPASQQTSEAGSVSDPGVRGKSGPQCRLQLPTSGTVTRRGLFRRLFRK
ncbi:concanavalin A-like lectin/glucanase [Dichomitus squalens LYAD-421 SS1]|uniref:Concanavalin A-like lectin/glucanase n=1 Tax=Dichomitus squalens (strain LYAD-421) TaxID=732165 RepID=R7SQ58_DICSQ|nr:concanavalin A-like lectin/glucanase [Dichomitus squalens LYAD-421 SS1]EJF57890.1 concanavalin A-like lectin/glucanase [Dichomitus squalens LYAD-421 SS1]